MVPLWQGGCLELLRDQSREYGREMSALEEGFEVDGLNVDVCRGMKVKSIVTNLMGKYSALSST